MKRDFNIAMAETVDRVLVSVMNRPRFKTTVSDAKIGIDYNANAIVRKVESQGFHYKLEIIPGKTTTYIWLKDEREMVFTATVRNREPQNLRKLGIIMCNKMKLRPLYVVTSQ